MFYPAIKPHAFGHLDVGDGHAIYWEECGNPNGEPIVFLHGGPGGGCSEMSRRFFNPQKFRIILFDQRGCGRSKFLVQKNALTLASMVNDMEILRNALGLESWHLFGGSWGSTLALAYASSHFRCVKGMILRGVFTSTRDELAWLYQEGGASRLFPIEWQQFKSHLSALHPLGAINFQNWETVLNACFQGLANASPKIQAQAAMTWAQWEHSVMSVAGLAPLGHEDLKRCFDMALSSCEMFLNDSQLNNDGRWINFEALHGIRCHVVQGQFDVVTPMHAAYQLHQKWPKSCLTIVREAGHASSDMALAKALIKSLDEW